MVRVLETTGRYGPVERTVYYSNSVASSGVYLIPGYKGRAYTYTFTIKLDKAMKIDYFLQNLSRRVAGLGNALPNIAGARMIGYRINVIGPNVTVTIFTDKPVKQEKLSFDDPISDIIGSIGNFFGNLFGGVQKGFTNLITPEQVIPSTRVGPDIGTILTIGLVLAGGYLLYDQFIRQKGIERGRYIEPAYAPIVREYAGVARTGLSAVGQATRTTGEVAKTAVPLLLL